MTDDSPKEALPVVLKWSKRTFTGPQIVPGSPTITFKREVQSITGVPLERQKLLCKHGWKGTLPSDSNFDHHLSLPKKQSALTVTLVGSAETLAEPPPPPKEVDQQISEEQAQAQAMERAEGMIVPLQFPPLYRQDGKMYNEMYQYNRIVSGLPQLQIEDLLKRRRDDPTNPRNALLGKVVMTMGLELRRAYVNALAVLPEGTLLSAHDDSHLQMWEHGTMVRDAVHEGPQEGGVDCLVTLNTENQANNAPVFASGGRGCVRLWTDEGDCVGVLGCPAGTSPSSLVSLPVSNDRFCLAASFRITRQSDPNQFRLPPQDAEGRARRAQAEAREEAMRESLARAARSVRVWYSVGDGTSSLQSIVLEPHQGREAAPVSSLAVLSGATQEGVAVLVCGDSVGGLRFWKGRFRGNQVQFEQWKLLQLQSPDAVVSVGCMESVPNGKLAVSTKWSTADHGGAVSLVGSVSLEAPFPNAVYIIDPDLGVVQRILKGHVDAVICMCSLPDGGLVTGGGKLDAKVRVWDPTQLSAVPFHEEDTSEAEPTATLEELGYVFALAVLPDSKPGSQHYALAAARYNVVKICL